MPLNIAILGLGGIARKMAYTVNKTEYAVLYAAASRGIEKANAFAKEFGAVKAFGSKGARRQSRFGLYRHSSRFSRRKRADVP